MPRSVYLYFITILLFIFTIQSSAQEIPDRFLQQTPGLAGRGMVNHVFTKRGDLPIHVSVWGSARTGRYEIPEGTNLGQMLSLAGGPGADMRGFVLGTDQRTRLDRGKTHIRLSRNTNGISQVVLETRISELLEGDLRNFPLQDGDIIMIDQVRRFNLWDAMMIISSTASFILLLDRIFTIF